MSPTPTATASATPTATATVNPTLYELDAPTVTARGGSNRVMLSWNKVTGASGYYIYSRKSYESVYQQTAVVKGADTVSYLIKSLPQNTTYYYRVAAYCEVSGTQIEGKLSTAVSAKTAAVSATSKGAKTYSTKAASHANRVLFIKDGQVFHQIYRGNLTNDELYVKIQDALMLITTGGEKHE